MNRTSSKIIGSFCVAATALSLSFATPTMSKGKEHKSHKGGVSLKSFRYDSRKDFGRKHRRSHVGFPFRGTFGHGVGAQTTTNVDQSGTFGTTLTVNEGPSAPLGLQITGTYMQSRSPAKVIFVSSEEKRIGEERAERRRDRFDVDGDKRVFRFYRENEAYDIRFPSVVYLDNR